jgi:hypothetical protein
MANPNTATESMVNKMFITIVDCPQAIPVNAGWWI